MQRKIINIIVYLALMTTFLALINDSKIFRIIMMIAWLILIAIIIYVTVQDVLKKDKQ